MPEYFAIIHGGSNRLHASIPNSAAVATLPLAASIKAHPHQIPYMTSFLSSLYPDTQSVSIGFVRKPLLFVVYRVPGYVLYIAVRTQTLNQ